MCVVGMKKERWRDMKSGDVINMKELDTCPVVRSKGTSGSSGGAVSYFGNNWCDSCERGSSGLLISGRTETFPLTQNEMGADVPLFILKMCFKITKLLLKFSAFHSVHSKDGMWRWRPEVVVVPVQ